MVNRVPGAVWDPITTQPRPLRGRGRGLIGHIAVSNSHNLRGNPAGNCWHLYLPKVGPAIQQLDLDVMCGCSRTGDLTCVSFESEGGVGTDVNYPWTPNQVEWAARVLLHMHRTEGVPLRSMTSSLPREGGFGTHRLGIDPYRVLGGESWSTHYAKECPGNARHAQRATVVSLALWLKGGGDDMPTVDEFWNHKVSEATGTAEKTLQDAREIARRAEQEAKYANLKIDAVLKALNVPVPSRPENL